MRALWILAASTTVVGETTTFRVTRLGRGEGACSRRGLTGAVPTDIDRRSRPQVSKSRVCGFRSRVVRTVRGVGSFSAAATALSEAMYPDLDRADVGAALAAVGDCVASLEAAAPALKTRWATAADGATRALGA